MKKILITGPVIRESPGEEYRHRFGKLSSLACDLVPPLAAGASLVASCLITSPKKELWVDEGYALQVVTDKSLYHTIYALSRGVDGGMPFYYIVAHLWAKVFGTSLLALRLFSCVCICVGVLVLWKTMRMIYSRVSVALGVLAVVVNSGIVLAQNVEIRYYGLYFAWAAIVLAVHRRLVQRTPRPKLVLFAVVAHGALVMSHPLGVLYSSVAILALLVSDYRNHALRPGLYARLCASWLTLLLWIRPIVNVYDIGRPHNWLVPPDLSEIVNFFSFSPFVFLSILLAVCLAAITPADRHDDRHDDGRKSSSSGMTLHAVGYLLVPIAVAITSWLWSPLYLDRYFLPSALGASMVLAQVLDSILPNERLILAQRLGASVLALLMLAWPVWNSWKAPKDENFEKLDRAVALGLPVVVEDGNTFVPLTYYTHQKPSPYYYVLDWETASHSPSRHATVQYKIMRNGKAVGYFKDRIIETRDALCGFDRFIVLDSPGISWFEERILPSPNYYVQKIGGIVSADPGPNHIWLVTQRYRSHDCGS